MRLIPTTKASPKTKTPTSCPNSRVNKHITLLCLLARALTHLFVVIQTILDLGNSVLANLGVEELIEDVAVFFSDQFYI
jgi:hypothetical protein